MSFYVTLPSNSSMDLYPNNTLTQFTVQLKEPLRLDVQYDVALVELTYKHSWSLEVGVLVVDIMNNGETDSFKLILHDGENISSFSNRLNGEIWMYYIQKDYNRRYELGVKGNSEKDIITPKSAFSNENRDFNVINQIRSSEWFKNIPAFSSDPFRFIIYLPNKSKVRFQGDILKILNLDPIWYQSSEDKKFIKSGLIDDPNPSLIQNLYITNMLETHLHHY